MVVLVLGFGADGRVSASPDSLGRSSTCGCEELARRAISESFVSSAEDNGESLLVLVPRLPEPQSKIPAETRLAGEVRVLSSSQLDYTICDGTNVPCAASSTGRIVRAGVRV